MYLEFLKLCGFEPDEIKQEEPRVRRAFEILDIGPEDVDKATERITTYYDVELIGIRKSLGIWVKELIDMVLAKEEGKKIVYASFPPTYQMVAAMTSASSDIYCVIPEVILGVTMNCIFTKATPILEAAERNGLAPGLAFCSYLQMRTGAIAKGIIPVPDLVVPSCLLCDQSPKVDELLHEVYGVSVAYADHLFGSGGAEWPNDISPQRVQYLAIEIKNAMGKFGDLFDHEITDEEFKEATKKEAELFNASLDLWEIMQADPLPLRINDLNMVTEIPAACSGRAMKEGANAFNILCKELKKRVEDGVGVLEEEAPRIMAAMVPYDPAILSIFDELGLAISVTSQLPIPGKNIEVSYDTIWEQVADLILRRRGALYSGLAYLSQARDLAKFKNVDGVILFHHIGCRQYNTWLLRAKMVIEQDLDIPVLIFEGDYCDTRDYNAKQARIKLETFAQIVKTAKASREEGK